MVDWTRVHCTNDDCNASTEPTCEGYEPSAIEVWNRRTPQPVVREAMTREQVKAIMAEAGYDREAPQPRADFITGLRHGERAHGITQKGGQ